MSSWNTALAVIGATLLLLGLSAGLIKNRWHVSEPLAALLAGALTSPLLAGWTALEPASQLRLLEEGARFTLTIALVDVAMSLPRTYLSSAWRSLAVMLVVVMPLMWIVSAALALGVLGLPFALAVVQGAVITPTDPVLAGSIVGGRLAEQSVPAPLRRLIAAESGANDALALPLVAFGILLATEHAETGILRWAVDVIVLEVLGGAAIGALAGWLTARGSRWAAAQGSSEHASLTSVALALAITLLGAVRLLHSDGVLAAFVAGLVLSRHLSGELAEQRRLFHETIRRFFELPIFFILGVALPLSDWVAAGWRLWAFAAAVLLLRRLPAVFSTSALIAPIETRRDAGFVGWFGPIGIAALYYAAMTARQTGHTELWTITSLVVTASVAVHGVTGTALTRRYGRLARRA